jgi:hypothetical protein
MNILKLIVFRLETDGMACNGFMWLRKGQIGGSCKQANELSGFRTMREESRIFLTYYFIKKAFYQRYHLINYISFVFSI